VLAQEAKPLVVGIYEVTFHSGNILYLL
jgi:hypothetical protein